MTLSDIEWLRKIFNAIKYRVHGLSATAELMYLQVTSVWLVDDEHVTSTQHQGTIKGEGSRNVERFCDKKVIQFVDTEAWRSEAVSMDRRHRDTQLPFPLITRSSAIAERPRDASCCWVFSLVAEGVLSRKINMLTFANLGSVRLPSLKFGGLRVRKIRRI